ncbi:O-Mevalon transferase [Lachnellula occidentalis]|uniref:O-Mevalon transferase n=1 Tax=Lachnellula occidentalis TaxID=215460 RepID=A0A8H8S0E5_9HELO|nr:O-Mevalon transferase [Lachnellula occidentalis]
MGPKMAAFPHLSATGPAPTYLEVAAVYRQEFYKHVAEGSLRPIVFPYHLYGLFLLIAYLCIPHTKRPYLYKARWLVLGAIAAFQWKTLCNTSSASITTAFAAGLVSAWVLVLSATWLVFNRPQFDSMRVELRMKSGVGNGSRRAEGDGEQVDMYKDAAYAEDSHFRRRQKANGYTNGEAEEGVHQEAPKTGSHQLSEYYWQSYPDKLSQRIDWVMDHLVNFRGPGWNWAIPILPTYPPSVKQALGEDPSVESRTGISRIGFKRPDTLPRFIAGYFLLDATKTFLMKDPYFIFGPTTYDSPPYFENLSPYALWFIRQTTTGFVLILALEMAFLTGSIIQCLLLGPKVLGLRGYAWQYSTNWGSIDNVLNKGLNGFWGSFWHQTFRFAFAAPTNFLIRNNYIEARSTAAKFFGLFFAFGISGFLHLAGSVSQLPQTYPWNSMILFLLQPIGILVQATACSYLRPSIEKLPKACRQAGNILYTLLFLFSTCWLMGDDFARGGVWLFEPVPISPLRGLGYGVEGDGWWCWGHIGVGWYTGAHWWESGIAF